MIHSSDFLSLSLFLISYSRIWDPVTAEWGLHEEGRGEKGWQDTTLSEKSVSGSWLKWWGRTRMKTANFAACVTNKEESVLLCARDREAKNPFPVIERRMKTHFLAPDAAFFSLVTRCTNLIKTPASTRFAHSHFSIHITFNSLLHWIPPPKSECRRRKSIECPDPAA